MGTLPIRSLSDPASDHLADHNALHPLFDVDEMALAANGTVLVKTGGVWVPGSVASGTVMHPPVVVASNDMPSAVKENAAYVCDATADQAQINSAIEQAAAISGRSAGAGSSGEAGEQRAAVQLSGGRFNISGPILMRTGVTLQGYGTLTEVRAVGVTSTGMVMLAETSVHKATLRDLWLHGNYASGGTTSSGVHYVSAGGGKNTYPPAGNDSELKILNVDVWGFRNNAARSGIVIDTDARMTSVIGCYLREIGGNAIHFISSPDSVINDCHIGAVDGRGLYIQGANVRVSATKAFYCDSWGFESTSGYVQLSNVEVQDSVNGFRFAGSHAVAVGIMSDTNDVTGIEIAANGVQLNGFQVACRSGARFANTNTGLVFTGTPNNLTVVGRVDSVNVTTKTSGVSSGAGNFVRVTGGGSLLAVG